MLAHGMLCALSKGYIDAVIASNPVAFWPLLSDTLDVVGSNNLTGSANFSAVPLINGYEKSLYDGGNTDLRANYAPFALNAFSVEFLIKSSDTANKVILENNQNSGFSIQTMPISGGVEIIMVVGNNTSNYLHGGLVDVSSSAKHIIISLSSSKVATVYYNGVQSASMTLPVAPSYSSASHLSVGSRDTLNGFIGNIAGLAFYNRVLSAQEAAAHYSAFLS